MCSRDRLSYLTQLLIILFSDAFVNNELISVRRCCGKLITPLILRMTVMSFHPVKCHAVLFFCRQQPFPEIHIFDRLMLEKCTEEYVDRIVKIEREGQTFLLEI